MLEGPPKAGEHKVHVKSICGEFDNSNSNAIKVPLAIDSFYPKILSHFGGDLITINGSGFSKDSGDIRVHIVDGPECKVLSSDLVKIVCITEPFDEDARRNLVAVELQVDVGEESSAQAVEVENTKGHTSGISPTSMSPVLDTELTIKLDDDFDEDFNVKNFEAEYQVISEKKPRGHWVFNYDTGAFEWVPDETSAWKLYVRRVDETEKTVTLRFKGAPSG